MSRDESDVVFGERRRECTEYHLGSLVMQRVMSSGLVAVVLVASLATTRGTSVAASASARVNRLSSGAQVNAYLTSAHFSG